MNVRRAEGACILQKKSGEMSQAAAGVIRSTSAFSRLCKQRREFRVDRSERNWSIHSKAFTFADSVPILAESHQWKCQIWENNN